MKVLVSWGPFYEKFLGKVSQCRKKLKGRTLRGFSTSILSQNSKKLKGDHLGKIFFRKSHNAIKTEKGDPLVSSGMACYTGKQEKPFWFSSLGQMVQFGAIIFGRTFVELFWSVQVVFKKTLTKSHDYIRLISPTKRKAPTKNVFGDIVTDQKKVANLLNYRFSKLGNFIGQCKFFKETFNISPIPNLPKFAFHLITLYECKLARSLNTKKPFGPSSIP